MFVFQLWEFISVRLETLSFNTVKHNAFTVFIRESLEFLSFVEVFNLYMCRNITFIGP